MQPIVSAEEWQLQHEAFLAKEKEFTRQRDALNAQRRQLPVTEITKEYRFMGSDGEVSLLDLFSGCTQLIIYHFMFAQSPCTGCSMMVDNMGHTAHLRARDTARVLISLAPYPLLAAYKQRMGWEHAWYSSAGSDFNRDFNVTSDSGEMFGVSVLIREGQRIFRSYFTTRRGAEYLGSNFTYLDLTPMGRQELWEQSPAWVEQTPPYQWWKKHDEY